MVAEGRRREAERAVDLDPAQRSQEEKELDDGEGCDTPYSFLDSPAFAVLYNQDGIAILQPIL